MLDLPDTLWFYCHAFSLKLLFLNCFSYTGPPHKASAIKLKQYKLVLKKTIAILPLVSFQFKSLWMYHFHKSILVEHKKIPLLDCWLSTNNSQFLLKCSDAFLEVYNINNFHSTVKLSTNLFIKSALLKCKDWVREEDMWLFLDIGWNTGWVIRLQMEWLWSNGPTGSWSQVVPLMGQYPGQYCFIWSRGWTHPHPI